MTPFLQKVAESTLAYYNENIKDQVFVFANRRAGLFFQKYLSEIAQKPIFSPKIMTVNDLFKSFTKRTVLDHINLLFILFKHYQKVSKQEENFDDFVFWGEMIINDFNDVDKYIVDAKQLFSNIKDLKELDAQFEGLTEDQIKHIREFWINFEPQKQGKTKDEFLSTWSILFPLYESFRNELDSINSVYEGFIFREVAEKIEKKGKLELETGDYIFVGLNALSRSEEVLLSYLLDQNKARFFWDVESPHLTDSNNKASFFINKLIKKYPHTLPIEIDPEIQKPRIESIGISSATGQAKQINAILNQLIDQKEIYSSEASINTAIILPDEKLLMPTLYSIPEKISTINVTMGYPLSSSPISGLMEHIFTMQINWRNVNQSPAFYYRYLLPVLNHRYITNLSPEVVQTLYKDIISNNRTFISNDLFCNDISLSKIFYPLKTDDNITDYLLSIIDIIQKNLVQQDKAKEEKSNLTDLEKEFIYQYYVTINRMRDLMISDRLSMNLETFFKLLRKLVAGINIPFEGEPLSGLQVMGVLETRSLDFENLIILSMNEGVFPLKNATNSFIPYNLRKGFGISTYEHQDSIYAYHFYRMIYRAKNIFLLYDTRSDGMQTGEVSRYIHQLKYHYRFNIDEKLITFDVALQQTDAISIKKNERILSILKSFVLGGSRSFSASSLNTYLDCSLKFYFQEIEKLSEEEEVSEEIESNQFGSIFHLAMENIFKPYIGNIVNKEILKRLIQDDKMVFSEIENAFNEVVYKNGKQKQLTGHNFLIASVIHRYSKQVFDIDQNIAPFLYKASEEKIQNDILIESGIAVQLKGSIDRVDEVNNTTRIIDYKTGGGKLNFTNIDELFDPTVPKRPKAVMQVFLYAWLYSKKYGTKNISPNIYFLRSIFSEFDPIIVHTPSRSEKERVENFSKYNDEFENRLSKLIEEIFNPSINFEQTTISQNCVYCQFKEVCRKE